jgi:secretion/DNA translocation related TadE-like protein
MREGGSATVIMLAVTGLLASATVGLASVGLAFSARVQATAAADAAALAAAVATYPGTGRGPPAAEADRLARANGAVLMACLCPIDSTFAVRTVTVRTSVPVMLPLFGRVSVSGAARAEFDPREWWGG